MTQNGDPRQFLGYKLKELQTALRARMDEALRPMRLTAPQYACLELLHRDPGASASDLARGAFVARQTMSSLLRGVVDRGLAERAERAPEGRALPLRLTEKGQALLKRASGEVARIERQMTSGFDGDRLARLREDLSGFVARGLILALGDGGSRRPRQAGVVSNSAPSGRTQTRPRFSA